MSSVANGQIARSGVILPATTWANRPAANQYPAGTILPVTGLGGPTPVFFEADPVSNYWYPMGGYQVVHYLQGTLAAPVASLTGDGTHKAFVLPRDLALPAGMLFPGLCVEVGAIFLSGVKTSHTGQVVCVLNASASGTSNAIWAVNATSSTSEQRLRGSSNGLVYAGGVTRVAPHSMLGSPVSTTSGTNVDQSDANIQTEARYVVPCLVSSYLDGVVDLLAISVALRA